MPCFLSVKRIITIQQLTSDSIATVDTKLRIRFLFDWTHVRNRNRVSLLGKIVHCSQWTMNNMRWRDITQKVEIFWTNLKFKAFFCCLCLKVIEDIEISNEENMAQAMKSAIFRRIASIYPKIGDIQFISVTSFLSHCRWFLTSCLVQQSIKPNTRYLIWENQNWFRC